MGQQQKQHKENHLKTKNKYFTFHSGAWASVSANGFQQQGAENALLIPIWSPYTPHCSPQISVNLILKCKQELCVIIMKAT